MAVTAPTDYPDDFTKSIAITSSIYTDADTHIEVVTFGRGGDSQSLLFAMMVEAAKRGTQPLHFLASATPASASGAESGADPRLVAPHDHPARDAVERELDAAEGQASPSRAARWC